MRKVVFVMALALSGCYSHVTSEPILIGQLAPPENEAAGRQARHGVELALDELNQGENLPLGRHVKVIYVDCRPDPVQAEAEAVRMLAVNRVAALLVDLRAPSVERVAVAARSNEAGLVTSSSLPGGRGVENLLATGLAPAAQGEALARFVKDGLEPRATAVAVFQDAQDARARAVADAFIAELKDSSVRAERRTFKNESDLPDMTEYLGKAKPGAVLVVGAPDLLGRLRGKVPAAAAPSYWLYAGDESQMGSLSEDSGAGKGVYLATAYVVDNGTPRGQDFARKYRERFKEEPEVLAALAYDDARILFDALGRSRTGLPPQVRDQLLSVQTFDSVTGPIAFKEHAAQRPAFVLRIEEKGTKLLKKYEFGK